MNTRLPYFNIPPPVPANTNFHATFPPPPFNPSTPPPSTSPSWASPRTGWKRNRNWNSQYNHTPPYTIPKKPYHNRFNYNRPIVNGANHQNGSSIKWNNKANTSSDSHDITEEMIPGIVATKKKRKPMSRSYPTTKWDENDAEKALVAEKENAKLLTNQSLIIRFPDPQLNKDMVKEFHGDIENVHFPQASTPRYCYAHLKEGTNIDEVVNKIEKIPFGQGFLKVELKRSQEDNKIVTKRDIDPYTLYVGNLPMNVTKAGVVQYFNACTRIDIGHPKQMKNSRYAFVRFGSVDDAIEAYKRTVNMLIESRSMIVRFRRINGVVGLPGENKGHSQQKAQQDQSLSKETSTTVKEKNELCDFKEPDMSLVKAEPVEHEDQDIKPSVDDLAMSSYDSSSIYSDVSSVISQNKIKKENLLPHINEDEIEDEEEEEDFDTTNDNFIYKNEACLEDECDDFEDDDDYDVDDEDLGLQMNGADNYLPGDDDEDIFNDM